MRRKNLDNSLIQGYLMDALLLLMKKKSYADISVGEIAERAGVHRATFYRHFASKDKLLSKCMSHMLLEAQGDMSLGNTDFATFIRPAFQAIYDNREQMLSLNRAGFSPVLLDALREYFHASEARDDSKSIGSIDASDSTDYGAQNMNNYRTAYRIGGIYACLLLWFSHDMRETPEEMTGIAVSMGNNNS